LCAFGASAAETSFTDDDDITYGQAVEVLSELGVITGYEDGSFLPNGTLTRAEACAIIVRLLNMEGVEGNSTFSDTQGHWAEDYIAYCDGAGIVAGYGDGTFGPDDTLTGYAWEKMLLCALGYDGDYESMTGVNWTIGVATLAKKLDLEKGLSSVSMNNSVSRDVAAKLAYNTMLGSVVTFHSNTSTVTSGDVSVNINSGSYYTYYDGTDVDDSDGDNVLEVFWNATVTEDTDDFGRPAKNYSIAAQNVDITVAEDPIATVTARTKAAAFASLLSGYKLLNADSDTSGKNWTGTKNINNSTKYDEGDVFWVYNSIMKNGDGQSTTITIPDGKETICEALEEKTANGLAVEFYATDDDNPLVITDIVFIEYTVGEVTKKSTSSGVTTYNVKPVDGGSTKEGTVDSEDASASTAFLADDVAKGDIVTYVYNANDTLYIYPTTNLEGTLTAYTTTNNANSLTVDGTRYSIGMGVLRTASATAGYADFSEETGNDITLYLDQYGYAVYSDESGTVSTDYVLIHSVKEDDDDEGETYYKVGYINAEGTTGTVYSYTEDLSTYVWMKMVTDSSNTGCYKFKAVSGSYENVASTLYNNKLSSGQSTINDNGDVANSSTTFILRTDSGYSVYTGLSNLSTYTFDSATAVYTLLKDDYAYAVYVDVRDGDSSDDSDEPIYLLKTTESGSVYENDTLYYTYDAIVDGEKTTITATEDADLVTGLVIPSYNSDGYVTKTKAVNTNNTKYRDTYTVNANESIDYSGGTLTIYTEDDDGNKTILQSYSLPDSVEVYYAHGNSYTLDVTDGYGLVGTQTGNTATISVICKSSTNDQVTALYYITRGSID
ncbi:MAG: S-layer homology domain-containing protein, partial [Lachnospiraceae bacterium]|nr:S-layer homology domain-containing protein [Lachnospiraceae bacterium]